MHPLTTDLAEQILALVRVEAYSLLGAIQDNKVVLGGSAGSGGGIGEPPAGFVGQLAQSNVTYDTAGSSRACAAGTSGSVSLVDNLDAIRLGIEICDDAIDERHIDWGFGASQVSAVDVPFQSSSGSISATDVREAIEEAWLHGGGVTDHGALTGLGDVADHPGYLLVDGTRALTGAWDAGAHLVTFGAGIAFDGATGVNVITVPDDMPQALIIEDSAGMVLVTIVTSDGQPAIKLNPDAEDIDIYLGAAIPNAAVYSQGSDGLLRFGAYGAGVARFDASGWLSSGTHDHSAAGEGGEIPATGLDMGIGDMLFSTADGLLLLGPHLPAEATEWWSGRRQKATISGAFHQEAGRWMGTPGLVVEEATTNLFTNPSIEVDTTSWIGAFATVSRDGTYSVFGDYALKVITDNAHIAEGVQVTVTGETAADTEYTFSVYLRGTGTVRLGLWDTNGLWTYSPVYTLNATWTRYELTATFSDGAGRVAAVWTDVQQDITFYIDGAQLEQQDYPTSYADGTLGAGYAWTGAAHGSTSTRAKTEVNLDAHVGLVSSNATLSFRVVVQMPYDADATWPNPAGNYLWDAWGAADRLLLTYRAAADTFAVFIDGADRLTSGVQTFKAGDWLDILVTVDFTANDYNLYVNGILEDNDTTALAVQVLTDWTLGTRHDNTVQDGYVICEYAVFDRVLTAIEVAGPYALQRPLVDAGSLGFRAIP